MRRANLVLTICLAALAVAAWAPATAKAQWAAHEERADFGYFTVFDEEGRQILTTGLIVSAGDRIIAEDDTEYEVVSVAGDEARARIVSSRESLLGGTMEESLPAAGVPAQGQPAVGIYHTHSDESYVPSDGTESRRGRGGVLKVGQVFAAALARRSLRAIHDDTSHDPHDAAAYDRSRRTAANLIKQGVTALFDVHRDTGSPESYTEEVDGKAVTKVMMVVGRENPNFSSNLAFAKRLKSVVDSRHPELLRAIFVTSGKFNQDLHPRAMLLEVGSHRTTREEAEAAVDLLADDVPEALSASPAAPGSGSESREGLKSVGRLLVLAAVVGAAYILTSTGSLEEAKQKIRRFVTEEFAGRLGPTQKDDIRKDREDR